MKKESNIRKWVRGLLAVASASLLWLAQPISCGPLSSPNPAAPPSPPAELPSALTFPQSVEIEFGTPSSESALNLVRPLVPIGGEFLDAIQFGFDVNSNANRTLESVLQTLTDLEVPLNPITRTFTLDEGFKIDFADFDYPGKPEACTGCTCPTGCDTECPTEAAEEDLKPVCYRLWSDDPSDDTNVLEPLIAGFMTRLPIKDDPNTPQDEANVGNGSFRAISVAADGHSTANLGAEYQHRITVRPFDKHTFLFVNVIDTPTPTTGSATVNYIDVSQTGLEGATDATQVLKSLRHAIGLENTIGVPEPDQALQYVAQFREDVDFWSGTFQNNLAATPFNTFATIPEDVENFTDECAQLSTAIEIEPLACVDLGINVTDVPLLEVTSSTDPDVTFPADVPTLPTFE